jgi:hypothetical protein
MEWTVGYFNNQAKKWRERKDRAAEAVLPGHVCYSAKQIAMWEHFALSAEEQFQRCRKMLNI